MDTLHDLDHAVMHRNVKHEHVPSEEEVVIEMNGHVRSDQVQIEIDADDKYEQKEGETATQEEPQSSLILDLLSYILGDDDADENQAIDEFDFGTDDEADPDFIASLTGEFRDKVCVGVEDGVFMGLKLPTDWGFEEDEELDEDEILALSHAVASLESVEQGSEHVVPRHEHVIQIEPSGGMYVLKHSGIVHFVYLVEKMRDNKPERKSARRSDLIYDVQHIVDRNGEYKSIDEKYYWAYKQMAQCTEQSIEIMQAACKCLEQGNAKLTKQNIEQAISTLRILVPEQVADSSQSS